MNQEKPGREADVDAGRGSAPAEWTVEGNNAKPRGGSCGRGPGAPGERNRGPRIAGLRALGLHGLWPGAGGVLRLGPRALGILLLSLAAASGCGREAARSADDISVRQVRVVSTTGMITDLVRQIGGERVAVEGLMGPGVDPHLYKASAGDVTRMQKADLVLYHGLHLEGAMAELFGHMREQIRTVAVAEAVPPERLLPLPDRPGLYDPHIWFDVSLWMLVAPAVAEALAALDPSHAAGYQARLQETLGRLAALHAEVQQRVAELPPERRVLITAHDAFAYFGRAYNLEVRGLQGTSTVTEAGTADLQQLAEMIVSRRIPAIFVESSVPRRTIEALKAAVSARGLEVAIGGELYSDALGNPGTPEGSYEGMVRHNVDTIVGALAGLHGKTRPR